MVNLIYLSPWPVGGFATFTSHLYRSLKLQGVEVNVYRCNRDKDERTVRHQKNMDFDYQNVSVKTLTKLIRKRDSAFIITAVARPEDFADPDTMYKLLQAGAWCCVQSTQELAQFPHVQKLHTMADRVLVIRESLQKIFKDRTAYLPHPYVRFYGHEEVEYGASSRRRRVCSLAMVATNKNPHMILEANRILRKPSQIVLLGRETTPFIGMALKKKYPHYVKPKGFKSQSEAVKLASKFKLAVDLSVYENDGGGTQYCMLEAADAGAVNVLHRDWSSKKGCMIEYKNCLAVSDVEELVEVVHGTSDRVLEDLREGGYRLLQEHSPEAVVRKMRKIGLF